MSPHTRAMIASSAYALITGQTVAGVYDHSAGQELQIAAEARGDRLQGLDGERSVKFGGSPTELRDEGGAVVTLQIDGMAAQGFDRASASHYSLTVSDQLVQLYDHGESAWFAFGIKSPDFSPARTPAG